MRRILAIDPGAERLGWAVIDTPFEGPPKPEVKASGVLGLERKDGEEFQAYKLRLVNYWAVKGENLLYEWSPTTLVNETVPAVGGGNFIAATQSELAKTAVTILQAWAFYRQLTVAQIGATTVKSAIGGRKNATKAKVRNGVISVLPDLADELKVETTGKKPVWDRSDALAIGLAYCGIKIT